MDTIHEDNVMSQVSSIRLPTEVTKSDFDGTDISALQMESVCDSDTIDDYWKQKYDKLMEEDNKVAKQVLGVVINNIASLLKCNISKKVSNREMNVDLCFRPVHRFSNKLLVPEAPR